MFGETLSRGMWVSLRRKRIAPRGFRAPATSEADDDDDDDSALSEGSVSSGEEDY